MDRSYLDESVCKFMEKKQNCLQYLDEVEAALQKFTQDFPSSQQGEDKKEALIPNLSVLRQKIQDSNLKILIAGQFKTGKSTTINAVLGKEVLPAYATPCTAVITEITHGETPRATLFFKEQIEEIPDDLYEEAAEHIQRYHGKNVPALELETDVENLGEELENYLVIPMSDKSQKESVAESPYALCRLCWPLSLCENGAIIIDSPGLNEAKARDKTTLDYVPQADIILHVMNSLQPYAVPDAQFIKMVEGIGGAPILFLLNRFDQLNTDKDKERVRKYVRSKLLSHSTYGEEGIFFIAAQMALDGRMDGDRAKLEQSGLLEFEHKIADVFNNERGKIKLGNVVQVQIDLEKLSKEYVPSLQTLLEQNVESLQSKFKKHQQEFDELEKKKQQIVTRMNERVSRCERSLSQELKNLFYTLEEQMPQIVDDLPLTPVKYPKKKDAEKWVNELNEGLMQHISTMLVTWSKGDGERLLQETLDEIKSDLEWDLRQFNERLQLLRSEMDMPVLDVASSLNVDGNDKIDGILAGVGMGIAAGLAGYGIAAFLPVLAAVSGPIGLVIAGLVGIISSILFCGDDTDAKRKVRVAFVGEVRKDLQEHKNEWVEKITQDIIKNFRSLTDNMANCLQRQIDDIKRPIQESIEMLEQDQANVAQKKHLLEEYRLEFTQLSDKGKQLVASL